MAVKLKHDHYHMSQKVTENPEVTLYVLSMAEGENLDKGIVLSSRSPNPGLLNF